jgi:hypothetical protein
LPVISSKHAFAVKQKHIFGPCALANPRYFTQKVIGTIFQKFYLPLLPCSPRRAGFTLAPLPFNAHAYRQTRQANSSSAANAKFYRKNLFVFSEFKPVALAV